MKLLLVEDDTEMIATLREELEDQYIVESTATGEEAEYLAATNNFDLIVLDLNLPDKNGEDVCKTIRKDRIHVPILVLTGEYNPDKKVTLLDVGADDYLTKPFTPSEFKARIRALLRRRLQPMNSHILSVHDLTVDLNKKTVERAGKSIPLRRKEYYLLEYLLINAGKVVTRGMILDHVWDTGSESIANVVDVHIKYLRDQIDRPFSKKLIKTVSGLGYKIEG